MDMAIMQSPATADQQELNRRYSHSQHSHQQGASQVSYPYELNGNIDCFQQHQINPMTPSINDYSLHQTATESGKVEPSQIAVNLTGASSIQPSWVKSHNYLDTDNEYASLTNGYDGAQPTTQTNAYYIQDPNRSFYLNSATLNAGQLTATNAGLNNDYQGYQVYNRPSSWLTPTGEDSSVCNYGYYETPNQQENAQAYCQPQTNPSHQYPPENYDTTPVRFPSYTMTSNAENDFTSHHNHVQSQQNSNFDPSRSQYYDGSCLPEQVGGKSLQHQIPYNQSNFEPCGVARSQSSLDNDRLTNQQQNTRLPETNQSWPTESRQLNGENQSRQRTTKQQTRFKSLSMVKASNSKQSHSGNGPIHRANQCGVCGRNYARPSTLKTHLRTHTNERPFKCNVCLKTFSQAANLTAHQRVHTGERPFSCPICGRQFSQSSSVITHLRTHSGERPYRCSMCSRTFSDSSTLTKHCRIHSGEKPYQCDYCPLNFSQSGNLSRHLKLHLMGTTNSNGSSSASSATSSSQSSTRYNNVYETQITSKKNKSNSPNIELATSIKLN